VSRRLLKSKVDVEVRCRYEIVICSLSIMKSRDISKGTWWIGSFRRLLRCDGYQLYV
jgi:hypothetical protein